MHGLPTQSLDDLRRDLDEAVALGTDHISAYGLIYEDGTPLKSAVQRGVIEPLTPDVEGEHYRTVMETLDKAGLPQYEISNYARPGRESLHNLIYWRNEAYLGVGVSAASFVGFLRSTNQYEMDRYMADSEKNGHATASSETLDSAARAREALVLELRLRRGVDAADFLKRWDLDLIAQPPLAKYLREGLMEQLPNGRYRISRQGMPVADGILSEFV